MYGQELKQLENLQNNPKKATGMSIIGSISTPGANALNKLTITPNFNPALIGVSNQLAGLRGAGQRAEIDSRGGTSYGDGIYSSVVSYTETKRRKRGEPVKIQRQIIFDGVVYQIEEELYSDSGHSSVYTSEDDYEIDKGIQKRFKNANPQVIKHETERQSEYSRSKTGTAYKTGNLGKLDPTEPAAIVEREGAETEDGD